MPMWVKKLLLGFGTAAATTAGALLDELAKVESLREISDVSIAIAVIMGGLAGWAVIKAWLSASPKES